MIRFEVTGATPEEFAENAMKAWGLLAIGLQQVMSATSPTTSPSPQVTLMPSTSSSGEMHGSESSSTASSPKVMPVSKPSPSIVPSDPVDDLFVEQKTADPAPKVVGTKASSTEKKTKGPKLDDLKTRLSEVLVAATERWDQKRANAYARKLLGCVGVQKISDMKPEHYPDFWGMSEGFLNGTQPE